MCQNCRLEAGKWRKWRKKRIFWKKVAGKFVDSKNSRTFATLSETNGCLAQLVQSICLTSRGSAVRIRQHPPRGIDRKVGSFFCLSTKPQIRNYAPNMIQKRKESASLVKRGHSASNVTIKTYKCPYPTMRLEAIRKITTISCRCYPKSFWNTLA